MCGFVGIVSNHIDSVKAYQSLQKLSHRGPDEEGIFFKDQVYFGHKRLVVVDKTHGKQPFLFNQYCMIYNGELYNTDELREDLKKKGYEFSGHSDTEVLIKMYAEYKEQCVDYLNGIFAFVIYDSEKDVLFACRDRAGVKPLFYSQTADSFMLSSELKTIVSYFDKRIISIEGLQEVLGLGPSHTPGKTAYKGIFELRPAHYLIYRNHEINITRYWNVKSEDFHDSFEDTVDKVRYLLEDSIRRQLVSDVPLCTYLSGGLDSTAITLISQKYKPDLETYSIDYEDNQKFFSANSFQVAEDNDFVKLVVERFKIQHHYCVISNEQLVETLKDALILRDVPGMADIDSSLYWFSKQIKPNFTVALSGECADEIFGGYPWFYRNLHGSSFPWLVNLSEREKLLNEPYQKQLKLTEYVQSSYLSTVKETPLTGLESIDEKRQKIMAYLNMMWFMTTLLDRKDRMTMGSSLEVRVPFADHRIMEYLYNVPWDMKFHEGREKGLLREAVKDIVPIEIVNRKKNPYPKTHHPLYEEMMRNLLKARLDNKESILYELFNKEALTQIMHDQSAFQTPWYGQLMTKPQLMAYLYQLDYWFHEYNLNIEGK